MHCRRRYWMLLVAAIFFASAFASETPLKIEQFDHASWGVDQGAPPRVVAIAQTTDEYMWIAAAEGLFRFDGLTFERYQAQPDPPLPPGPPISLLATSDGGLWIGFYSGEISFLRNGHAVNYGKADGAPKDAILSLAQDHAGTIWAGSAYGLVRLENNRWKNIGSDWNFPGTTAPAIHVDRAGTLWVATENTIVFLPKGASKFQLTGIHVGEASKFAEAPSGELWMAETTRSVRPVPLDTGLALSDTTEIEVGSADLLFARDGALWITTLGDGLRRAPDPEKLRGKIGRLSSVVEIYATKNGLSSDYDQCVFQDRDGNIWVGTDRGLDRFRTPHPVGGRLSINPQTKSPYIQSIIADGKSYVRWNDLELPAGTKNVQIDYTVAGLADPYRARFRYKLDGIDAQWQDANRRRTAYYTNLGPGIYKFHVIAGDMDDAWSSSAATINFTIPPLWFQTIWFRAFFVVVLLLCFWTAYRIHLRQVERRFSLALDTRVDERTRIARELHDTLIQSVDGLMIYLQAAIDEPDRGRGRAMLENALDRADAVLSEGRDRVHLLRGDSVTVEDLVQGLSDYAQERVQDGCVQFILVEHGDRRPLVPLVREEIFRMAREALSNAFDHSAAKTIKVSLHYDVYKFSLTVWDDGKGIPIDFLKEGRPGHWGLAGMRERARYVGGRLDIASDPTEGTMIRIRIPGHAAYPRSLKLFFSAIFRRRGDSARQ